jgi:hypothetical protein
LLALPLPLLQPPSPLLLLQPLRLPVRSTRQLDAPAVEVAAAAAGGGWQQHQGLPLLWLQQALQVC